MDVWRAGGEATKWWIRKSQIKILNKYKLITNQYFIIPVSEVYVFSARPSQGDEQFQLTMATKITTVLKADIYVNT